MRLVGVGLEELGVEEFIEGGWFKGELFIDSSKEAYKKIGFRRLNVFTLGPSMLAKKTRDALSKSKELNITGNLKGDGWQNGGTFVIDTSGKALLKFRQESPGEHVENNEILKALGLPEDSAGNGQPQMVCDDQACAME